MALAGCDQPPVPRMTAAAMDAGGPPIDPRGQLPITVTPDKPSGLEVEHCPDALAAPAWDVFPAPVLAQRVDHLKTAP